jgi:manganese efflux pump family protein
VWAAVALAFGLAMDATAVCAARAFGARARDRAAAQSQAIDDTGRRELVILPLLFGACQAGMASLGWLGGRAIGEYIAAWDHWVAFGLLVAIGGKMIHEAWRGEAKADRPGSALLYAGLALATSIDAAAAGLTLHLLPTDPALTLTLIGVITAACSAAGYAAGRALGHKLGAKLEVLGGLVLVAIGLDILIRAA